MKPSTPVVFKAYRMPEPYLLEKFGDDRYTEAHVNVNGRPLPLRLDLRNHSPDGHEWGYGGSGPAQTALAILAFLYGDEMAEKYYMDFKFKVIAGKPFDGWEMTSDEIDNWLREHVAFLESKGINL